MLRDVFFDWRFLFGRFDGRIGPMAWRCGVIALLALSMAIDGILAFLLAPDSIAGRIMTLTVSVGLLFPFTALCAKRFQDRGRSGDLSLLLAGPLAVHAALNANGVLDGEGWLSSLFGLLILAFCLWFVLELGFCAGRTIADDHGTQADQPLTHLGRLP